MESQREQRVIEEPRDQLYYFTALGSAASPSNSGKSCCAYMISQTYVTITLLKLNKNEIQQYVYMDHKVSKQWRREAEP